MTHRASIDIGDNDFLNECGQDSVYNTAIDMTFFLNQIKPAYADEIIYHRENGCSPNCVICKEEAKRSHMLPPVTIRPLKEMGEPGAVYDEKPKGERVYPLAVHEVDAIRAEYVEMRKQIDAGNPPANYRTL
jgi:hypothetical protein